MNYKIQDFIDVARVRELLESFSQATSIATAIIDIEGAVLIATGWQDICKNFHRNCPQTAEKCLRSDTALAGAMAAGEQYHLYKCLNGLVDVAVPIIVRGKHIGNLFTGQFLLEPPDEDFFRKQAASYGFDEQAYLAALAKVPVISESEAKPIIDFLLHLTNLLAEMGLSRIKQIETMEELKASTKKWQSTFDAIKDGVFIIDKDYKVLQCNQSVIGLLNRPQEEIVGQVCYEMVHGTKEPLAECPVARALKSGKSEISVLPIGDKWFAVTADLIFDDDGTLRGTVHTMRDVTEQRLASEKIESLARFPAENPNPVLRISREGKVLYANQASADLLASWECSQGEILHEHLRKVFSEILDDGVHRLVELDCGHKIYAMSCAPIEGADFVNLYGLDITNRKAEEIDLKKAKEAAEVANRAKDRFLANMSHEIRTPITAIMGFVNLLMNRELPFAERLGYMETIYKNSEHLLTIINDILDLTQIDAKKLKLEVQECSPIEIIEEVRDLLKSRAGKKRLDFVAGYKFPLPKTIRTDPTRLRQILVNLVGNAIKFTDTGKVQISAAFFREEDDTPRMRFEVSDTGIGVAEADMPKLFHPFTQVEESVDRRFGGTGLGLTISQDLAKLLGGRIEVRSEVGKGSAFWFSINIGPVDEVEMLDAMPESASASITAEDEQQPAKIQGYLLLSEDDEDLQYLLNRYLASTGLEVDTASDGEQAYEMAVKSKENGRPYDLILMDVRMPKIDGLELTRRLRDEGWQGPIIAQTAHALTGNREKCLEAGCDDYIAKPSSPEELYQKIAPYLPPAAVKNNGK